MNTTLPTDSEARKGVPLVSGCLDYFPAALAGVARISKAGNDKHNPGQPLHHARGKSTDHADCIVRHLVDVQGLLADLDRAGEYLLKDGILDEYQRNILTEVSALAWRALALSQELHERFGAPLAPGARLPDGPRPVVCELSPVDFGAVGEPVTVATGNEAGEFDGSQLVVMAAPPVREVWINSAPSNPQPAAPAPFRIEAGKRYLRRNGKTSGVIQKRGSREYPYTDSVTGFSYTETGAYWAHDKPDQDDLIAEYNGPESGE